MPLLSRSDYLYQARIYDNSNNLLALVDDLVSLQYRKVVNEPGLAVLTVPDGHRLLSQLVDDLLLEVYFIYRPLNAEITDVADFLGLYRDKQAVTDEDGNIHYLLFFPGAAEVLGRNIIAYPAGTNLKTTWASETMGNIAADIVTSNCTASATTGNGRHRNANVVRSLSVLAAVGTPTISYSESYRNVLETVQELAAGGGFDFDVVRNGATTNLKFQEFFPQLGTDKSDTVIFNLSLDNIRSAALNGERLREKTVAIVAGAGAGAARDISVRTGVNRSASNDYEIFLDARTNTTAELPAIGDGKMLELQARTSVDIDFAASSGYVYKRDYGLGDLVTVSFGDVTQTKKIVLVEVNFSQDQAVNVRLEFADV
jgi:hypothetical protein